jgi:hypothetical protein
MLNAVLRLGIFVCASLVLVACGGGNTIETPPPDIAALAVPEGGVPFASGPISSACLSDRRAQSSRARCGCIQAVADATLSNSQQRRATAYFDDPGSLQEVRQSDNPGNERFWSAWSSFAETAEQLCRRT